MNKETFIKNCAAIGVAPSLLTAILDADSKTITIENHKKKRVAIDIDAISNLGSGDKRMGASEVLKIFLETGILIYRKTYNMGPDYNPITIIDP